MDVVLLKITERCLKLEEMAFEIYRDISQIFHEKELSRFFRDMANDEVEHIEFWKNVKALVETGAIKDILDNKDELLNELIKTIEVVERMKNDLKSMSDTKKIFVLTFYLETYIMRPSFGLIFYFVKNVSTIKNPIDTYQFHLERFINQFRRQNIEYIEITSIANIIFQLYMENVQLSKLSYVDVLSGLLNRRGLFSSLYTLAHILSRNGNPSGLIMIDIDNFKDINDEYGHQVGDQIISSIGSIIRACIRGSDIAGRYGGEEFLIFLPDVKKNMVTRIADNIRVKVEEEMSSRFSVTISGGCAFVDKITNPEEDIRKLIKQADDNLYISKKGGKNRITYLEN
ncbi:MAG: diguanylate cyclase [Deltaproteobacteria bacterium]|nr:diguanylate cyclase [Deltaproteobacteria bacterium]